MRRAQVTVFIIIGLILLVGGALVTYFVMQRQIAPIERVVAVPEDLRQVYDYVETCMQEVGRDGLTILGAQGGYINLPPALANNPHSFLSADPLGVLKIPLWYYEGEDRTPTEDFVERELAVFIRDRLSDCVDNFRAFEGRFDVVQKSSIEPVVYLTEKDVVAKVSWTLDVTVQERTGTLTEFVTTFPVRLKQMRDLAEKIMITENRDAWFENLTISLLAANPDIPVSGMEVSCGTKRWHLRDVKDDVQVMLSNILPLIRVENTQYPAPLRPLREYARLKRDAANIQEDLLAGKDVDWPDDTPEDAFQFNRMMFDVNSKSTDLKAGFILGPDVRINADPNDGGALVSNNIKGPRKFLSFLCINQWHFAYDLIYPVKSLIRDDRAFNNDGFIFQFAFPVIIEDNEPERVYFGLREFRPATFGTSFCNQRGSQSVDVRATGFVEGALVAEELGANISYRCLQQQCSLGETYSDGSGAIRLLTYLPEGCTNPLIIAEKSGFLPGQEHLQGNKLELFMQKLQRMTYDIQVHPYHFGFERWQYGQEYTKFSPNEHATISVTLHNDSFDQFLSYPADPEAWYGDRSALSGLSNITDVMKNEVDFVYGDALYDVDILLLKGEQIIGGYHKEKLSITYEDIVGNNHVTFHVVEWRPNVFGEDPDIAEKFMFMYENGLYEGVPYADVLRPTFSRK